MCACKHIDSHFRVTLRVDMYSGYCQGSIWQGYHHVIVSYFIRTANRSFIARYVFSELTIRFKLKFNALEFNKNSSSLRTGRGHCYGFFDLLIVNLSNANRRIFIEGSSTKTNSTIASRIDSR